MDITDLPLPRDRAAEEREAEAAFAAPHSSARPSLQFKIGDRIYWLSRSKDGNAWQIVANGDLVEHASILHYGDVGAFMMLANRLREIESLWASRK